MRQWLRLHKPVQRGTIECVSINHYYYTLYHPSRLLQLRAAAKGKNVRIFGDNILYENREISIVLYGVSILNFMFHGMRYNNSAS
jgi:hypothetical protein